VAERGPAETLCLHYVWRGESALRQVTRKRRVGAADAALSDTGDLRSGARTKTMKVEPTFIVNFVLTV
jgi:hypothetical protein